jgi:hypothetical protein
MQFKKSIRVSNVNYLRPKNLCRSVIYKLKEIFTHNIFEISLFFFWYISCFPGKLNFDSSELIRLILDERQTAWWGASFYWYVYFTSFKGEQIFVSSFVSLVVYTFALRKLSQKLPTSSNIQRRARIIFMMTPIYGTFGVTVSHDVFLVSGILLLFSELIDHRRIIDFSYIPNIKIVLLAFILLMTNQAGIVIALTCCLILYFRMPIKLVLLLPVIFLIYFAPKLAINESFAENHIVGSLNRVMLSDIKCVAQHPEISESEIIDWGLLNYSTLANWRKPVSCSSIDLALIALEPVNYPSHLDKSLYSSYLSVISRAPAVVLMSHIQRSQNALPPIIFPTPENQVNQNPDLPIGITSNLAIQDGPILLHPSVDLDSVDIDNKLTKILSVPSQTLTFLVNQASWFWGWGGFWYLFIALFVLLRARCTKIRDVVFLTSPFLIQHLIIFSLGAGSIGRYVMCSISAGFFLAIVMALEALNKLNDREL